MSHVPIIILDKDGNEVVTYPPHGGEEGGRRAGEISPVIARYYNGDAAFVDKQKKKALKGIPEISFDSLPPDVQKEIKEILR